MPRRWCGPTTTPTPTRWSIPWTPSTPGPPRSSPSTVRTRPSSASTGTRSTWRRRPGRAATSCAGATSTSAWPSCRWSPTAARPSRRTDGRLTFYASTQMPHRLHDSSPGRSAIERDAVRVVTPQVGGGFGGKAGIYPEYSAVAAAAAVARPPGDVGADPQRGHGQRCRTAAAQIQYVELGCTTRRARSPGCGCASSATPAPTRASARYLPGGTRRMSQRHVRVRRDPVRRRRRGHEHHTDRRLPRRRPPGGDGAARARSSTRPPSSSASTRSSCAGAT